LDSLGDYVEEPFSIIDSYFKGHYLERLVRHQTDSYNHFIRYQIQRTIHMFNNTIIHSENDYVPQYNKYLIEIDISFDNFKLLPANSRE
jgi:DNA-directed RNA polymerase beta subunit